MTERPNSTLSQVGAAYLTATARLHRIVQNLPGDGEFLSPSARYDLRRFGLIENLRPSFWRMTELGRAVQAHLQEVAADA